MKKLIMVIMVCISMLSLTAQKITLTFNGANKNINYQVAIDGISYYSNSTMDANTRIINGRKNITITGLQPGAHTVAVYRMRNNTGIYNNGSGAVPRTALYSNTIQLRQGYDMNIRINGNGRVSWGETRARVNTRAVTPMSPAAFDLLVQNIQGKLLQSRKLTLIRDAINTTGNYFTTAQAGTLLQFISSEANRLAMAKLIYGKVADPANFTSLYNVFTTVASRDDMNAFIRNNPNYNTTGTVIYTPPVVTTPMAEYQFSQLLQSMNSQYSEAGKFKIARDAFNNTANRFTTAQIRQLLTPITGDYDRLTLAKLSYARVHDPANFSTLYDLISSTAGRTELNNFVIQSGGTGGVIVQTNTNVPMSDYDFNRLLQSVNSQYNDAGRFNTARDAFNNSTNRFTTAQIRQILTPITGDYDRLTLAKLSYARVSDPANFSTLYDLLSSTASRTELNNFVIQSGGTGGVVVQTNTNVPMSDYDFNRLLQSVNSQYNDAGRFNTARDAFNNSTNRFTTAQIRQILMPITGDYDRLTLAKLSYARVYDPANFSSLYDLLSNTASRTELNNFVIQSGGTGTVITNTRIAMDNASFTQLYQQAAGHILPWNKVKDVNLFFTNTGYNFSVAQINQFLSIISNQTDRLSLAKLAWARVTDPANFNQTIALFASQADRDALATYIQSRPY